MGGHVWVTLSKFFEFVSYFIYVSRLFGEVDLVHSYFGFEHQKGDKFQF